MFAILIILIQLLIPSLALASSQYNAPFTDEEANVSTRREHTLSPLMALDAPIQHHILSFLDAKSLVRVEQTCHVLRGFKDDMTLWDNVVINGSLPSLDRHPGAHSKDFSDHVRSNPKLFHAIVERFLLSYFKTFSNDDNRHFMALSHTNIPSGKDLLKRLFPNESALFWVDVVNGQYIAQELPLATSCLSQFFDPNYEKASLVIYKKDDTPFNSPPLLIKLAADVDQLELVSPLEGKELFSLKFEKSENMPQLLSNIHFLPYRQRWHYIDDLFFGRIKSSGEYIVRENERLYIGKAGFMQEWPILSRQFYRPLEISGHWHPSEVVYSQEALQAERPTYHIYTRMTCERGSLDYYGLSQILGSVKEI